MQGEEAIRNGLSKLEITDHFAKIFEQEENTGCFQCGKKSKQWAETRHAIFLCLTCAANYKDLGKVAQVKSISLDLWNQSQLGKLKVGGNRRFKEFLLKYQIAQLTPKEFLRSQAAHYYRQTLENQISGRPIEQQPELLEGKKPHKADIPITEMTTDEMMQEAKQKLFWFGGKTKQYGSKAYTTVHHKVTSGELKQDAKKAGNTVSTTAKDVWGFLQTKYVEATKKQEPAQRASSTKQKQADSL